MGSRRKTNDISKSPKNESSRLSIGGSEFHSLGDLGVMADRHCASLPGTWQDHPITEQELYRNRHDAETLARTGSYAA
jgi:hypothetical protein